MTQSRSGSQAPPKSRPPSAAGGRGSKGSGQLRALLIRSLVLDVQQIRHGPDAQVRVRRLSGEDDGIRSQLTSL
jgi:hypothetical protein